MSRLKKTLFAVSLLLGLLVASLFFFRDFWIRWGANTFLLAGAPYSIYLKSVHTERQKGWNHYTFKIQGSFEKAPFTTEGVVKLIPFQADPLKLRIDGLPLTALNRKMSLKTGFVFTRGTADVNASGSFKITDIRMNANVVLRNVSVQEEKFRLLPTKRGLMNYFMANQDKIQVQVYLSGNPLNPNVRWSANIQQFLNPMKMPEQIIQKTFSPFKKLFPERSR